MPYASAATIAALPGPVMRRPSRHAPNTPSGSAPTTTIVRAKPGRAEQDRAEDREDPELRRRRRRRSRGPSSASRT